MTVVSAFAFLRGLPVKPTRNFHGFFGQIVRKMMYLRWEWCEHKIENIEGPPGVTSSMTSCIRLKDPVEMSARSNHPLRLLYSPRKAFCSPPSGFFEKERESCSAMSSPPTGLLQLHFHVAQFGQEQKSQRCFRGRKQYYREKDFSLIGAVRILSLGQSLLYSAGASRSKVWRESTCLGINFSFDKDIGDCQ